jgi:hypothetical protein
MIYASGVEEIPKNYIDLGTMEIPKEGYLASISLPYIKPEGVNRAPFRDRSSIILERLVVDGTEIMKNRLFLSEKKFVDTLNDEEASEEEEVRFIDMSWSVRRVENKVNGSIEMLSYKSETGNTSKVEQYIVPYGSKEVFLTYNLIISTYTRGSGKVEYFHTVSQTVKWIIEWPEEQTTNTGE